jgi:hypothetical protein
VGLEEEAVVYHLMGATSEHQIRPALLKKTEKPQGPEMLDDSGHDSILSVYCNSGIFSSYLY